METRDDNKDKAVLAEGETLESAEEGTASSPKPTGDETATDKNEENKRKREDSDKEEPSSKRIRLRSSSSKDSDTITTPQDDEAAYNNKAAPETPSKEISKPSEDLSEIPTSKPAKKKSQEKRRLPSKLF